ncbi:MAG: DUF1028 domain-containing protein [Hyphomicrobiaceae bacterium]|nr:DUF1028 domain-containing protein [Hyphomicrobiaceae bacterium]
MTWSIIARDEATGRVGIVVATRFFAVGALVPHVKTGVGAVATQAFINPSYGPQGLALLQAGASADDAVKFLTTADAGRGHRQLHVMDRHGRFAAFTGESCIEWCGHQIRSALSVAGNMLAGPQVIGATVAAYEGNLAVPFARRLIAAMQAGEKAGGDKRGRQSAALLVHDGEDYPLLDIRVDDHPDPLRELARLEGVARRHWVHFRRLMPSRENPGGLADRADLEDRIAASIAEGYE